MPYSTLMVHLDTDKSNAALLRFVDDFARRLKADVIGIAAGQPMKLIYTDGYVPANLVQQDFEQLEASIKAAEKEFRDALRGQASNVEWRSTVTVAPLADYIAHEARSADLIITTAPSDASFLESEHHVNAGDLVMLAGRPVLVVPAETTTPKLDRVLVGWKETREARRAIVDALPILKAATHVIVAEIADQDEMDEARMHLGQVVTWLQRHGVVAAASAVASKGDDANQLNAIAAQNSIDVVVAGAYGHSRVREWALGGVTRDLLLRGERYALISH